MPHRTPLGTIQRKVLLLLAGGLALGLSKSPTRYFRILRIIGKEWNTINRQALSRAIRTLYESKLIEGHNNPDGSLTLVLSSEGKKRVLTFQLDQMTIKRPATWDKKWRIVIFDIPEHRKKTRDTLRHHLKELRFHELQKSVFIHPYPCKDEVDFLIEFHQLTPHVRQITADWIDNELHLKHKFHLP